MVEDVRPISRSSPSTCWKIRYNSRNDTAEIMPGHWRSSITAGQRHVQHFWNPTVLTEVVPRALRTGNPTTLTWTHYLLGELVNDTDPTRAAAEYRAAVACGTPADSRLFVVITRSSAAALAARIGDLDEAFTALPQVLDQWLRLGNAAAAFFLVQHVGVALARAGADRDAAVIAGAVRGHIHEMPGFAVDAERLEAALAQVRARLGDTATDAALAEGEPLSLHASLAAAGRALAVRPAQPATDESRPPTTPDSALRSGPMTR